MTAAWDPHIASAVMSSEQSVDADMAASDEHLEVSLEDLESCESPAFDYDAIFDERFSQALDVEKLFQGEMNESPEGLACGVYTSQAAQASQNPACLVNASCEMFARQKSARINRISSIISQAVCRHMAGTCCQHHLLRSGVMTFFGICPSRQCRAGRLPPIRHPSRPDLRHRPTGCTPRGQCRSRMSRRRQLLMVTPGEAAEAGARVAGEQRLCQLLGPFPELCCHQKPLAASSIGSDRFSMPSSLRGCAYQRSRGVA